MESRTEVFVRPYISPYESLNTFMDQLLKMDSAPRHGSAQTMQVPERAVNAQGDMLITLDRILARPHAHTSTHCNTGAEKRIDRDVRKAKAAIANRKTRYTYARANSRHRARARIRVRASHSSARLLA